MNAQLIKTNIYFFYTLPIVPKLIKYDILLNYSILSNYLISGTESAVGYR